MSKQVYKKLKFLLLNVVGSVQVMNDDSNLFIDDLEKLTNMVRACGANHQQMKKIITLGQAMIDDTDDAIFEQAYKDGTIFEDYTKSVINSLYHQHKTN